MEDFSAWSREAVQTMRTRNAAWMDEYDVSDDAYEWSYDPPEMVFERDNDKVIADLCVIGSVSESDGTFQWAWANDMVPAAAKHLLGAVQTFGEDNQLPLLTEASHPGGLGRGKECACIAGRILEADGFFIEPGREFTLLFTLHDFRVA